jgi:hypothetical protein
MSKPIFIIRFPAERLTVGEREVVIEQADLIGKKLSDYHVLPVFDIHTSEIKFECFNAPHTEMEFEELKRRVLELIKQ